MKIYIPIFIFLGFGALAMVPQELDAKTVEVEMTSDLRFVPANVSINVGDTIRWKNTAGMTHTTTNGYNCTAYGPFLWDYDVSPWDETVPSGQTFERVFLETGEFGYFCAVASHCQSGMVGTINVAASSAMPLPESQVGFSPLPASVPVLDSAPAYANPIGLGSVADGADTLEVKIKTIGFSGPADVYFAIFSPQALGDDIFLYTGGTLVALSEAGLVPWVANTNGPLNQDFFGAVPLSDLPSGTYSLYFAVAPANSSLATFYLWSVAFTVP
jgi:plastocyanin